MSDYCYDRECPTNGGFSFPCSRCLDGMMGKAPRRIAGNQRASTSENAGAEAPSKPDSVAVAGSDREGSNK